MRQRLAHPKPRRKQHRRPHPLALEHQPQLLGEQVGAVQPAVHPGDPGELAALPAGAVLRVLPQPIPGTLQLAGEGHLPPLRAVFQTSRRTSSSASVATPARRGTGRRTAPPAGSAPPPWWRSTPPRPRLASRTWVQRAGPRASKHPPEGGGVTAGRGPHQPAGVVVDDHGQVRVAALGGDLVDPDPAQPVKPVAGRLRVGGDARDDPADGRPRHPQQLADRLLARCAPPATRGVSSNARVRRAPWRAHGTATTTTPCSGQRTRGASASMNARTVPRSSARQRLRPSP